MGTVWVARTGAWEDKTQEAAALLARAFQDLQGPGGHETALTADTARLLSGWQTVTLMDPTDLAVASPDVHISVWARYSRWG